MSVQSYWHITIKLPAKAKETSYMRRWNEREYGSGRWEGMLQKAVLWLLQGYFT